MAANYIEGVQSKGVGTSLKHYAVNNQEFQRFTVSAEVDERTFSLTSTRIFRQWLMLAAGGARISGAGHNVRRENYPAFMNAVEAFLSQLHT